MIELNPRTRIARLVRLESILPPPTSRRLVSSRLEKYAHIFTSRRAPRACVHPPRRTAPRTHRLLLLDAPSSLLVRRAKTTVRHAAVSRKFRL